MEQMDGTFRKLAVPLPEKPKHFPHDYVGFGFGYLFFFHLKFSVMNINMEPLRNFWDEIGDKKVPTEIRKLTIERAIAEAPAEKARKINSKTPFARISAYKPDLVKFSAEFWRVVTGLGKETVEQVKELVQLYGIAEYIPRDQAYIVISVIDFYVKNQITILQAAVFARTSINNTLLQVSFVSTKNIFEYLAPQLDGYNMRMAGNFHYIYHHLADKMIERVWNIISSSPVVEEASELIIKSNRREFTYSTFHDARFNLMNQYAALFSSSKFPPRHVLGPIYTASFATGHKALHNQIMTPLRREVQDAALPGVEIHYLAGNMYIRVVKIPNRRPGIRRLMARGRRPIGVPISGALDNCFLNCLYQYYREMEANSTSATTKSTCRAYMRKLAECDDSVKKKGIGVDSEDLDVISRAAGVNTVFYDVTGNIWEEHPAVPHPKKKTIPILVTSDEESLHATLAPQFVTDKRREREIITLPYSRGEALEKVLNEQIIPTMMRTGLGFKCFRRQNGTLFGIQTYSKKYREAIDPSIEPLYLADAGEGADEINPFYKTYSGFLPPSNGIEKYEMDAKFAKLMKAAAHTFPHITFNAGRGKVNGNWWIYDRNGSYMSYKTLPLWDHYGFPGAPRAIISAPPHDPHGLAGYDPLMDEDNYWFIIGKCENKSTYMKEKNYLQEGAIYTAIELRKIRELGIGEFEITHYVKASRDDRFDRSLQKLKYPEDKDEMRIKIGKLTAKKVGASKTFICRDIDLPHYLWWYRKHEPHEEGDKHYEIDEIEEREAVVPGKAVGRAGYYQISLRCKDKVPLWKRANHIRSYILGYQNVAMMEAAHLAEAEGAILISEHMDSLYFDRRVASLDKQLGKTLGRWKRKHLKQITWVAPPGAIDGCILCGDKECPTQSWGSQIGGDRRKLKRKQWVSHVPTTLPIPCGGPIKPHHEMFDKHRIIIIEGPAGGGKSTLANEIFRGESLTLTFTRKLRDEIQEKGSRALTYHRFAEINTKKKTVVYNYNNVIIDDAGIISMKDIDKIFAKTGTGTNIIITCDKLQLQPLQEGEDGPERGEYFTNSRWLWGHRSQIKHIFVDTDYRFDPEYKPVIARQRELLAKQLDSGVLAYEYTMAMEKNRDFVTRCLKELLPALPAQPLPEGESVYITPSPKRSIAADEAVGGVVREWKSVHSLQGITVPPEKKLVIDMRPNIRYIWGFDPALFYVAVSRVRSANQIVLLTE